MLRFAEEMLILVADEGSDEVNVPDRTLRYALAGAVLMDLAIEHRIDTDTQSLYLTDPTPLGDDLLDPILEDIACGEPTDTRTCEFWVRRIAQQADGLRAGFLERLVEQDILEAEEDGVFFALTNRVFRSRRYPPSVDDEAQREVHSRILGVLFSDDIPPTRDVIIVSLAHACGLFSRLMMADEFEEVKERIELVADLELVARSVSDAIRRLTLAESQAARRAIRESGGGWPRASGWLPVIGHAHKMTGNLSVFFTEQYLKHGPVFEVNAPGNRFVVIAGQEANQFVAREGRSHLRTKELWDGFRHSLGVASLLSGLDGTNHRLLRRTKRSGYSRKHILERMPEAVAVVEREMDELPFERPTPVVYVMQRVMVEQLTQLSASASSLEHIDDIIAFSNAMHMIFVTRRRPKFMMRMPRVRRARRRLELLIERVLEEHEAKPDDGSPRDLIDDLLELHRSHPDFLAETDMFINAMSPFMVGLDTVASITSFALYALLKHPDLLERVREEADELFADGEPTDEGMRRMITTRNVLMETMRMYPVGPALSRTVNNSFEFGGYRIPDGTNLLIATTVTHNLPEFFPEPQRFDIDRYSPERREHVQPGAYVPFGLGHHSCMGQGFAEVQMVLTIAALLHRAEIDLEPPGYRLKSKYTPTPKPDDKFKVRLRPRR